MLSPWRSSEKNIGQVTENTENNFKNSIDAIPLRTWQLVFLLLCFFLEVFIAISRMPPFSSIFADSLFVDKAANLSLGAKTPSSTEDSKTVRRDRLLPVPPSSVSSSVFCNSSGGDVKFLCMALLYLLLL